MSKRFALFAVVVVLLLIALLPVLGQDQDMEEVEAVEPTLLTDPFLQLPTVDGVYVVWFTEWEGQRHFVAVNGVEFEAETMKMSRLAEDQGSWIGAQQADGTLYTAYTPRDVWRHEAYVDGLETGARIPYSVTSITDEGVEVLSDEFSLAPLPAIDQPLRILLTSDNQLMPMTPANMQKVQETVGMVDAVFLSGDLQNIPDRASEWFDDNRGRAFFPALQGNSIAPLERTLVRDGVTYVSTMTYTGGELIQHAPLFPAAGNHEVMGRFNPGNGLNAQYNDPQPRAVAEARYEQIAELINPENDPAIREQWIMDNSYNTITYQEIFRLPDNSPGGETYYAIEFGDIYMISLYTARIWRTPGLGDNARGKYRESLVDLNRPDNWGYGDFIFQDLHEGSEQYDWLVEQLNSEAFQNAKYKIVLMHQMPHGVGDNYNPVFTDPVQTIDYDENGRIEAVRYEYPIEDDILIRDIQPLLEEYGVQLVHGGHSHLWFRMFKDGVNYIETSNVGNNYGCYLEGYKSRGNVPNDPRYNADNYVAFGDPHGLDPIFPSIMSPQQDDNGADLPCINSNDLTAFSIFDTATGMISSYVFDTREPESEVMLFDEFSIISGE